MIDFSVENNVDIKDRLLSRITLLNWDNLKIICNTTNNWIMLPLFYFGITKNFTVRFKDGTTKVYTNPRRLFNDAILKYVSKTKTTRSRGDIVSFDYAGRRIAFKGNIGIYAAIILENFIKQEYSCLNVREKTVLDIGANIGDTAIYFAINGAKAVYALEPFPYAYNIARRNIRLNNLSKNVRLINEACGGSDHHIKIDPRFENTGSTILRRFKEGKRIRVVSLDTLTGEYGIANASMKIDCEGSEYEIILKASDETLRKYSDIIIEYHYGYRNLEKKLKQAGFTVRHTIPIFIPDKELSSYGMLRGIMYARLTRKVS